MRQEDNHLDSSHTLWPVMCSHQEQRDAAEPHDTFELEGHTLVVGFSSTSSCTGRDTNGHNIPSCD